MNGVKGGDVGAREVLDKGADVKVNMKSELTTLTFLLHVPDGILNV